MLVKTLYGLKNAAFSSRVGELKPEQKWDGNNKSVKFSIGGVSDSVYAACKIIGRSVSGYDVYLEGSEISVKRMMQKKLPL